MAKTTIPVELSSTPGITDNSNATAITIDSSENVTFAGGLVVPSTITHVGDTDTKLDFNQANTLRLITGDNTAWICNASSMVVNEDSIDFDFRVESNDNANALFVDGGANVVGIGTNTPAIASGNAGLVIHSTTGGTGSTGASRLRFTNTTTGQASTDGFEFSLDGNTNNFYIENRESTGDTIFYQSSEKLRIQSGGGISFNGDTAAANALDDYEEGTWTPTINSGTISGAGGYYTKIGRVVTVSYYYNLTTLGSSTTTVVVGGLPFAAKTAGGNGQQTVGSILCRFFTKNQIVSYLADNDTNLYYYNNGSGDFDSITFGEIEASYDNDFAAHGTHTYITS